MTVTSTSATTLSIAEQDSKVTGLVKEAMVSIPDEFASEQVSQGQLAEAETKHQDCRDAMIALCAQYNTKFQGVAGKGKRTTTLSPEEAILLAEQVGNLISMKTKAELHESRVQAIDDETNAKTFHNEAARIFNKTVESFNNHLSRVFKNFANLADAQRPQFNAAMGAAYRQANGKLELKNLGMNNFKNLFSIA